MTVKITRYGLSPKAGGWDPYGDSNTDQWEGNHGNTLTTASCAITDATRQGLGARNGDLIRIVWDNHTEQFRRVDDTAPESDARVDLFYPYHDNPSVPDKADVTIFRP